MKRIATLVSTAALVLGSVLAGQQPAAAAPSCHGSTCEGKDPQRAGCSTGASNLGEFTENGVRFELRYSPVCASVWTRATSSRDWNLLFGQVRSETLQRKPKKVYGAQVLKGTTWTAMMNVNGQYLRACYSDTWHTADSDGCTRAY